MIGLSGVMAFLRQEFADKLHRLAANGVYFGTSSWKYPGWVGSIYEHDRYVWRGKFSEARFERTCLAEYAETFPAVSVDASYYQFFKQSALEAMAAQVPDHFLFGFKVCGDISLKRFPNLPRFGPRAGADNPRFLDSTLFNDATLVAAEGIRSKVGLFMFEFSHFHSNEFERGGQFVEALDAFFDQLPKGWPYGVELRNRQWLQPDYFSMLQRHGVTHIYNGWTDMPPVPEQMAIAGSDTNPDLLAARFLLKEGRTFDAAVKKFSPYEEIKEPNPESRAAAGALARRVLNTGGKTKALIFVNNRFEGNSPSTIRAILDSMENAP
jgi:uncharacterized protein YecE (DUF72 family)